ncbi:hypothetical protein SAMN04487948_101180 [Halogranum amylolyticum]|uniref:Zinc-ribbon domain-containing protein n=1 Tax=Halogranum amylolyticum TaxID=660520 RepID=A0A1H8MYF4_9EURY|nr:zinc ribbon domain-containing protein [Halogranum amylolyticum]SEO22299.1 hypothetical protein SAMN04487948_101180 [Halogranum amylolyticum]
MTTPSGSESSRTRDPDEAFCRDCGARISAQAEICPECGIRQLPPPRSSVDSALGELLEGGNPFVAAALSALIPGLGQLYNRELEKGLGFIVASLFAVLSAVIVVGFVLYPIIWVYAIYDAYTTAERAAVDRDGPRAAATTRTDAVATDDTGTSGTDDATVDASTTDHLGDADRPTDGEKREQSN